MKHHTYQCHGTCSRSIDIVLDDEHYITSVIINGGCHGNTQGISRLVVGMSAAEAIRRLEGIRCKDKPTSCPDQLALALKEAMSRKAE